MARRGPRAPGRSHVALVDWLLGGMSPLASPVGVPLERIVLVPTRCAPDGGGTGGGPMTVHFPNVTSCGTCGHTTEVSAGASRLMRWARKRGEPTFLLLGARCGEGGTTIVLADGSPEPHPLVCPVDGCDGWASRLTDRINWGCGFCDALWPTRELLDEDIRDRVAREPRAARHYVMTESGIDPVPMRHLSREE